MKINTNRVAAYLAGNLPPYYKPFPKIEFILLLSSKAADIFVNERFDLIEKHTSTLQQFFSEALNLLKDEPNLLGDIIADLKIPYDAMGPGYINADFGNVKIEKENEKTIGFITPFDGEKNITEPFIKEILDNNFNGWKTQTAQLKAHNGKYVWNSIETFLTKFPVYLADVRDGNLNVALETGYILGSRKKDAKVILLVDEDVKISNLQGMIRVAKGKNNTKAGEDPKKAEKRQSEINEKLKNELITQFESYLQ